MQAWQRFQSTRHTDEKAFETLKLADDTRVAIRKINEAHRPQARILMGLSVEEASQLLERDEDARRTAIGVLLGPDEAKDFYAAEVASTPAAAATPDGLPAPIPAGEGSHPSPGLAADAGVSSAPSPAGSPGEAGPSSAPEPAVPDAGS
jgi:hypothetical protein